MGAVSGDFLFAIPTPFERAAAPKLSFAIVLSPEGLRVAGASQLLVCLIHKKNPFLTALHFLQVPGLYHPEQGVMLLARA